MTRQEPPPLVSVKGLRVSFEDRRVLDGIDLDIRSGEIVTLIGPNGAGKTTLVRAILGLLKPEAGTVLRKPNLTFGYVPQRFAVDPTLPLTVSRLLSLPRKRGRAESEQALSEVGAAYTIDKPIQGLSGGEFQRVMLARALLRRPDLLVLDEPLQGVDVSGQAALFELVGRLRRLHGFGVLLVSHDLHLVMRATDRVICMNHHVCCHGTPHDVTRHPEYLRLFGPEAARSLAVYTHMHDHDHDLRGEVVTLHEDGPTTRRAGGGGS